MDEDAAPGSARQCGSDALARSIVGKNICLEVDLACGVIACRFEGGEVFAAGAQ